MIALNKITKIYSADGIETKALDDVSLSIEQGEMVAITGPSGSGKSTLLNIIGCMDKPTNGSLKINGEDVDYNKTNKWHDARKNNISFVFQSFALMEKYSVYENVEMPLIARGIGAKERKKIVEEKLNRLGINDLSKKLTTNISGGQRQRVAIARALASDTPIILADEPTGSLDQLNGKEVLDIFTELNKEGKTIILITHDLDIASRCRRQIHIVDGKIISDKIV